MRSRQREGGFRCRTPQTGKGLVVFICISFILPQFASGCQGNETLQCNTDGCSCIPCDNCPPGQGLYPQCGKTLKGNMTMKCIPCKSGISFSGVNDFESCHGCDVCVGQETLRKCTPTQNTLCKKGCMDGFHLDKTYKLCVKVHPTPSKEKTTIPQKTSTGSSAELISILTPTNASSNNSSSQNDTKQVIPTSIKPPTAPLKYNWITRLEIMFYVLVAIVSLILLVIGFWKREKIIRFLCHIYCSCRGPRSVDRQDADEGTPMNPQEEHCLVEIIHNPEQSTNPSRPHLLDPQANASSSSPEQQGRSLGQGDPRPQLLDKEEDPEDIITGDIQTVDNAVVPSPAEQQGERVEGATAAGLPDHVPLYFKDLQSDLKSDLSIKISKKGPTLGWKKIGGYFNITEQKIEEIETRCSYGEAIKLPGEFLFELLESSRPDLTVKEFIDALKAINRNDVISYIFSYHNGK